MRRMRLVLFFLCYTPFAFATFPKPSLTDSLQTHSSVSQVLSSFGRLSAKEYEQRAGKKLSFLQKLSLKWAQHRLQKHPAKKLDALAAIGGFFLGFYFSIIGVGIAYLIRKNKTLRTSAWIGFGIATLIFLIVFVLLVTGAVSF